MPSVKVISCVDGLKVIVPPLTLIVFLKISLVPRLMVRSSAPSLSCGVIEMVPSLETPSPKLASAVAVTSRV